MGTYQRNTVSIVISAFNEQDNIRVLYEEILQAMQEIALESYELIWVNDGSTDHTLEECRKLCAIDKQCRIVNFMRNYGHEIAMTAGMDYATGDAVIFMDADLQHPPKYLPQMIALWKDGIDVVLTKRIANHDESVWTKYRGIFYYKILNFLSDTKIPCQSPDFRLIDRKYVDVLKKMGERGRMFRGMLSWLGMPNYAEIAFVSPKRFSGSTKYNFRKSLSLAMDGIIQFSTHPLRLAIYVGLLTIGIISCIALYTLWEYFFKGVVQNGYSTTIITIVFVASVQLIFMGIIGEYIGRIHLEVKKRPLYFAEFITEEHNDPSD